MTTPPHFYAVVWQRTKDQQCFVTIPRRTKDFARFVADAPVIITLADDPTVRMRSAIRDRGDGGRYAKIMRRGQPELADRFADEVEVRVELEEAEG